MNVTRLCDWHTALVARFQSDGIGSEDLDNVTAALARSCDDCEVEE